MTREDFQNQLRQGNRPDITAGLYQLRFIKNLPRASKESSLVSSPTSTRYLSLDALATITFVDSQNKTECPSVGQNE